MYAVMRIVREATVDVNGFEQSVPLTLAEGMIGAIPLFEKYEDALAADGDDKYKILEVRMREM